MEVSHDLNRAKLLGLQVEIHLVEIERHARLTRCPEAAEKLRESARRLHRSANAIETELNRTAQSWGDPQGGDSGADYAET